EGRESRHPDELGPAWMSLTTTLKRRPPIYSWPRHRKLVLRVTPSLVRLRLGALAILLLQDVERRGYANVDVVETLYRTCSSLGRTKQAQHYRAKILRGRALRAA